MSWTTHDEFDFLAHLGQSGTGIDAAVLLRGYLTAARQRVRWEAIDREAVISFAEHRLRVIDQAMDVLTPGDHEYQADTEQQEVVR